jgi:hypothetical protein
MACFLTQTFGEGINKRCKYFELLDVGSTCYKPPLGCAARQGALGAALMTRMLGCFIESFIFLFFFK